MLDGRFRSTVDKGVEPIGNSIRKTGLSADHFTIFGLVLSVASCVAIGTGNLRLGLLLVVLTGLCDTFDGAVAKAAGTSSVRGAFFDSVADRVSDSFLFFGVAWYFTTTDPGPMALLPMAVLATSSVISYQRAKAESLGLAAKGGIMERAERIILLSLGLLFEALLVPVLVIMLALTLFTAAQRFVKVWRQAGQGRPVSATRTLRRNPRRRTRSTRPTVAERRENWRRRHDRGR
jgi:CDP-diacylglycerol--glycerol-3-phosphate 3-phosphatidyltransferase